MSRTKLPIFGLMMVFLVFATMLYFIVDSA